MCKMIVCGWYHIVIQNEKNEIYVCCDNVYVKLGLSGNKDRYKFEKVEYDFGGVKNIACGGYHMIIQNEKNEIYVCGNNECGQLGLGGYEYRYRYKFEKVEENFGKIKNIVCGGDYTIIQNEKNEVYACGDNECGQLGLGDYYRRGKFEKVKQNLGKIKKIACGYCHTVIQNEKNEIYVCGDNHSGQLGLGDKKNRDKFEKVEYDFGKIKNIACGRYYTIIQNEKNEIFVCGDGYSGQSGLGNNIDKNKFEKIDFDHKQIKNMVCGGYHVVIQNEKNEVYVCGYNHYGQLGLINDNNKNIFEKVNTDDIFEKIYNFEIRLNTEEIVL